MRIEMVVEIQIETKTHCIYNANPAQQSWQVHTCHEVISHHHRKQQARAQDDGQEARH